MTEGESRREPTQAPETEVKSWIRPAVAHVAFGAIDSNLFNPDVKSVTEDQKKDLLTRKPEELKYTGANAVSWDSRHEEYKNDSREFEEINKDWNEKFWKGVKDLAKDDKVDAGVIKERKAAFDSLGLTDHSKKIEDDTMKNGLFLQAEAFRTKYVAKDKSNIKDFVQDLANGDDCKNTDGSVNLNKLTSRINAIEPILAVFGKHNDANLLVKDFVIAHGMLSQSEAFKEKLVTYAADQITKPLNSENTRIKALWEKESEIAKKFTPDEQDALEKKNKEALGAQEALSNVQEETERALKRRLFPGEVDMIQKGATKDEMLKKIRENLDQAFETARKDIDKQSETKPENARSLLIIPSETELEWAIEISGTTRQDILSQLKEDYKDSQEAGEDPVYAVQLSKDSLNNKYIPLFGVIDRSGKAKEEPENPPKDEAEKGEEEEKLPTGLRIKGTDGNYYTVFPNQPSIAHNDNDELVAVDAKELIEKGEIDIVQEGLPVTDKEGKEYTVEGIRIETDEAPIVILRGPDDQSKPLLLDEFREQLTADDGEWKIKDEKPEQEPPTPEEPIKEQVNQEPPTSEAPAQQQPNQETARPEESAPENQTQEQQSRNETEQTDEIPDDSIERKKYFDKTFKPLTMLQMEDFRAAFTDDVKDKYIEYLKKELVNLIDNKRPDTPTNTYRFPGTIAGVGGNSEVQKALIQRIITLKEGKVVDKDTALGMSFKDFVREYLGFTELPEGYDTSFSEPTKPEESRES